MACRATECRHGFSTGSLRGLAPADSADGAADGPGAVPGSGDEVAVDLVGDLDALVAEPAGDLGDRDARYANFNGRTFTDNAMDVQLSLMTNTALGDDVPIPARPRKRAEFPYYSE